MRTLIYLISIIFVLLSCKSDATEDIDILLRSKVQRWELYRMTGSFVNSETMGDDMDWQEYILLDSKGTFFKSRRQDGILGQATGTYEFITIEHSKYYELTYETGHELIASCSGNGKEILVYDGEQLNGTWNACDGPGLEYRLIK